MEILWALVSIIKFFISICFGIAELAVNVLKSCCAPEQPQRKKRIESEECAVCLESIKNRIEVTCGHEYCAECIIQMWERTKSQVSCPMCRNPISVIFVEFKKDDDNKEIVDKLHNYNNSYVEKRSILTKLIEMPHLMKKWISSLERMNNIWKERVSIIYVSIALLYLFSPIDLIPEILFGPIGYVDDFFIVVSIFMTVTQMFLRQYVQEH